MKRDNQNVLLGGTKAERGESKTDFSGGRENHFLGRGSQRIPKKQQGRGGRGCSRSRRRGPLVVPWRKNLFQKNNQGGGKSIKENGPSRIGWIVGTIGILR